MDPTHFLAQNQQGKPAFHAATKVEIDEFYQSVNWSALRKAKTVLRLIPTKLAPPAARPAIKAGVGGFPAE